MNTNICEIIQLSILDVINLRLVKIRISSVDLTFLKIIFNILNARLFLI